MKRATITLPDDLEAEIDAYLAFQETPPSLTVLVQAALRRYLEERRLTDREFRPPAGDLEITATEAGGGRPYDVSLHHDSYVAEPEPE
jgi:hypothetical protein